MNRSHTPKNPHVGGSLDDFLKEEGIYEDVNRTATQRVAAMRRASNPGSGATVKPRPAAPFSMQDGTPMPRHSRNRPQTRKLAGSRDPDILRTDVYPEVKSVQVSRWGNSLAIRLPATVVEALWLKEGDDIEIHAAGRRSFEIAKAPDARELLARLRKFRGRLPKDFKFDRLEANERR